MKPRFSSSSSLVTACILFCGPCLLAADYNWDGSTNGSWIVGTNWVENPGTVTMGIGSVQTFQAIGAANLSTYLGGGRVIGTLVFNANADSDVTVRFATSAVGGSAANLTFDVASGSAGINVDSGAAGNFTLGVSDGSIILSDNLLITHNGSGNLTVNRPITGSGFGLTKEGSGLLSLSAANTFNGGVALSAGTLNLNHASALGNTSGTFLINGGTLNNTSASAITTGSNPITINGDFAFTGTRDLNLGAGAATLGTATGASRTVTVNAGELTLGGIVANGTTARGLVKEGNGTLTLSAVNTYNGGTTINAGTVKAGVANTFGTGNGTAVVIGSSGTLDVNGKGLLISNLTGSGTVDNTSASANTLQVGLNNSGGTFSGVIQNSGGGAVSLWNWGTGTMVLSGASSYTGLTWVVGGTLSINSIGSIGSPAASALGSPTDASNGAIRFGSGSATAGTLRYTGSTVVTDRAIDLRGTTAGGSLDASGTGTITFTSNLIVTNAGSKTLTLQGTNTGANTFAGNIADQSPGNLISVTKAGTGTWVLEGTNTYSGLTNVSAGKLVVNGSSTGGGSLHSRRERHPRRQRHDWNQQWQRHHSGNPVAR